MRRPYSAAAAVACGNLCAKMRWLEQLNLWAETEDISALRGVTEAQREALLALGTVDKGWD